MPWYPSPCRAQTKDSSADVCIAEFAKDSDLSLSLHVGHRIPVLPPVPFHSLRGGFLQYSLVRLGLGAVLNYSRAGSPLPFEGGTTKLSAELGCAQRRT